MAGGIDWFRWHHGSVTDPKFQLVAKKAGARLGDVITVWAFILEKASADADRGTIGELDFETLDFLLGADSGTAVRILDAMTARGLLSGSRVAKWEERQPKREREGDHSAERTRAYRERQKSQGDATTTHVTPSDATERPGTPRGEESRGEEEIHSVPNGTGAEAPLPALPNGRTGAILEFPPPLGPPAQQSRSESRGSDDPELLPPASPASTQLRGRPRAAPDREPDAVWDTGLDYLVANGCKEQAARGFLGKMRQAVGDLEAAELLAKAQEQHVSEPLAWLRAAAKRRLNGGRSHTGVSL